MDYDIPQRRKSKTDKRAKARYNRYKKGGGKLTRSGSSMKQINKKGFELAIGTLVVIILGILVLVVLIYGFSTGWSVFWGKITAFGGGKNNVQIIIDTCTIACTSGQSYDYCTLKRTVVEDKNEVEKTCKELEAQYDLSCPSISCT